MKLLKTLPFLLVAMTCLSGCEYDEWIAYYEKPRPVFQGRSYPPQEMVVVERRPVRHYARPRVYTYTDRPRTYYYRRTPYGNRSDLYADGGYSRDSSGGSSAPEQRQGTGSEGPAGH